MNKCCAANLWILSEHFPDRCVFECVQYVSALRPPKTTPHAVNVGKTMNNNDREASGQVESRLRVCSFSHQRSPPPQWHKLPRRSLQNLPMSSQLSWSVEEELKRRRRLAGFDQSYGELQRSDSDPECGATAETDEHEWKQVSDGNHFWQSFAQVIWNIQCLYHVCFIQPDSGHVVEWPHAPKWLRSQWGARWRLLLGSRRHWGGAGKTQPAAPHPLPWVQTGRLWVLPQPQGEHKHSHSSLISEGQKSSFSLRLLLLLIS